MVGLKHRSEFNTRNDIYLHNHRVQIYTVGELQGSKGPWEKIREGISFTLALLFTHVHTVGRSRVQENYTQGKIGYSEAKTHRRFTKLEIHRARGSLSHNHPVMRLSATRS